MKIKLNQQGTILLIFLLTFPFLILMAMYYMSLSLTSFSVGRLDQLHTEAQLAADAGADYSIEQLALNNAWAGTGSEVALHSDSKLRTTFITSVSGNSSSKTIAITGKTYWPASATTPTRTVSIDVDLYPVTVGNYSIVAGAGGLYMSNNSKVVGGGVFINGEINMSNSAQIGLSTSPVAVQVADDICPPGGGASYPRVCTAADNAGQPITISNPAHIYGTVTATNQTDGSGMSSPGLVTGGSAIPQALPTYDRAGQKAAVNPANNMTGAAASCTSNNGNVIWPANTKITGDVTVSHQCTVTIKGNVWITGNLSTQNSSQIIVDNSLGTTMPVIMVDGSSGFNMIQSSKLTPNSSNTGVEVITFYSTASCSPDCNSVTGNDLSNSRVLTTISLGNLTGGANSVFYAYWTQASLGNSGQIGAVIGQTIQLSNSATITFGSSTGGVGTTTWIVRGYHKQ
ncbi:MAG TPA: hypothetical protein VH234_02720 [Candidatus Saccharimonadales bacterium]|jgi:hypothetical protein|nr:hypothetical protein [Candidatus Saccharimonadales bacterium]